MRGIAYAVTNPDVSFQSLGRHCPPRTRSGYDTPDVDRFATKRKVIDAVPNLCRQGQEWRLGCVRSGAGNHQYLKSTPFDVLFQLT